MEIGNSRQITYTLDLTRQYYNLLERTEESQSQRYFWDGNVAAYEENGRRNYYLQDDLGSPLRLEDSFGTIKENYEYGVFGEDLYQNQGKIQPFGYTGYQRMRFQEPTMPRQRISGREWQVCRAGFDLKRSCQEDTLLFQYRDKLCMHPWYEILW